MNTLSKGATRRDVKKYCVLGDKQYIIRNFFYDKSEKTVTIQCVGGFVNLSKITGLSKLQSGKIIPYDGMMIKVLNTFWDNKNLSNKCSFVVVKSSSPKIIVNADSVHVVEQEDLYNNRMLEEIQDAYNEKYYIQTIKTVKSGGKVIVGGPDQVEPFYSIDEAVQFYQDLAEDFPNDTIKRIVSSSGRRFTEKGKELIQSERTRKTIAELATNGNSMHK